MEAASLKPEIQIPKKSKSPNLRKESMRVLNWDLKIVWDLGLGIYFEYEVRDLVVEVRTSVSSARFGFPSASTPLPV
jgi:hypothetical protein